MSMHRRRAGRGLTTIELLVTLAVAALLLGLAAPSLYGMIQRKRVVGLAEELRADLRVAQRTAMGSVGPAMAVHFASDATQSCYVVYSTIFGPGMAECSCRNTPPCNLSGLTMVKQVSFASSTGVRLTPSSGSTPLTETIVVFRKSDGALTQGYGYVTDLTLGVEAGGGGELKLQLNPTGRSRLCSTDGRHAGYPTC